VLVRAYAVMASAQRANGDLRSANRYLEKAANIADGCTSGDDRAEVKIRFTMLLLYRAQDHEGSFDPAELRAALEQADLAIELSKSSLTKARALNARGVVRVRSGDPSGGAQDAKRALTLLGSMHRPFDHASATSVLIWALAHGTQAEREEAIEHLERLRKALPPRSPEMRARLFWAEALLYVPNRRRKARAKRLLDRARKTFLKLEMHAEAIAVTAELARIDPAGAVPHLCTELLSILDQHPVRRLVERLHRARLVERVDLADQLRASLQAPGLLPVPAWPRS
jgi:tetratricopeptide (TPR) repeat protein